MRPRPLLWFVICLLCLAGAYYFWELGEARRLAQHPASAGKAQPASHPAPVKLHTVKSGSSSPLVQSLIQSGNQGATNVAAVTTNRLAYRLTNTGKSMDELLSDSHAILLENALIDTRSPLPVIPEALRAQGDPGTYIVQSRGPLDDAFRALLAQAGASIVSYIPNNAYLVRASAAVAGQLLGSPQTQAVVPYEPYYKLQSPLLSLAVQNEALPEGTQLNVLLFADQAATTAADLKRAGYTVLAQSGSPFGPVVMVQPPPTRWVPLAQMPGVQLLEMRHARMSANDLSRVTMGTAADTVTLTNYLGLTGSNVLVNINDTSVDATHPDLAGRVFGDINADYEGHGTFVAGIIAGNGTESSTINSPPNLPSGSVTGADFRGEAPGAELFSLDFQSYSDQYLQETAAQTNALISNNSWYYANDNSYDLAAASFDAAVRDALPERPGSQPMIYVFAAGNEGNGNDSGQNGNPDSITSPGTAKNVITVGAIEQDRNITNVVVGYKGDTNAIPVWEGMTDSSNQVASFSSRGNVGVGIEGDFGRFKPDVVAPGTFVVSTRSAQWDQALYYNPTNIYYNTFLNQAVDPLSLLGYTFFTPINAVELHLDVYPNQYSLQPFAPQVIYVSQSGFPDTTNYDFFDTNHVYMPPLGGSPLFVKGGNIFYSIYNTTNLPSVFDLQTTLWTTNDLGDYQNVLSNLNNTLGPYYRYESGTSMSAGAISGMLALMEEFFMREGHTNSPALMKALVINGARSVNSVYDMQVENSINYQGWGLANLPSSLPPTNLFVTEGVNEAQSENIATPMILVDQSAEGALATGQAWTRTIKVDPTAQADPLRVTLVWTDPPGNPAASPKLVNNLDLVVTNLDTGDVYYGNDINSGFNFNQPHPASDTNTPPKFDTINNVENVFLQAPVSTNYTITVIGRSVNVNAVTANTNQVAQDYALVISSGDGLNTNALTMVGSALDLSGATNNVTKLSGTAFNNAHDAVSYLRNQRVGANSPLIGDNTIALGANPNWGSGGVITLGVTNQWHFYVVTNTGATADFTNAAFVTFLPPNLSVPRMGVNDENNPSDATRAEADIDLYVSQDHQLTNLVPSAIAAADKSLSRGGTEFVVYENSAPGDVYYVGVKSEDQEAAQYQFLTDFSDVPFSSDDNGNPVLRGIPVPQDIPDGSPQNPGQATVVAISPRPVTIRRVVVYDTLEHQNFGDLIGTLRHGRPFAVLNNHTFGNGDYLQHFVYEDNGENDIPGSQHSDGPGSLRNFVGEQGAGVWTLTEMDTALTHTGLVDSVTIRLDREDLANGTTNTIAPFSWQYYALDVPPTATNLTITITNISQNPLPLDLYAARGYFPTQSKYDKHATILPPGGSLTITKNDLPPLQPGRYYIGVYNPNNVDQTYIIYATMEFDANIRPTDFTSASAVPILDDAVTYDTLDLSTIPKNVNVFSVNVGVAIQHPRISDLVLTLISPQGSRNLLMENRGGTSTAGAGGSGGGGTVMQNGFEGLPAVTYFAGTYFAGEWYIESGSIDILQNYWQPGFVSDTGQECLDINGDGPGTISTNLALVVGQTYRLSLAYTRNPGSLGPPAVVPTANINVNGSLLLSLSASYTNSWANINWQSTSAVFTATSPIEKLQAVSTSSGKSGMLLDSFKVDPVQSGYLTFTEDTNLTQVPIKFATTPFTVPSATGYVQWPQAAGGNGHWYKAVVNPAANPLTWAQCDQAAHAAGGYLATITSLAENDFVFSNLIDAPIYFEGVNGNGSGPAIGGINDGPTATNWTWETGEPWTYTPYQFPWYAGQPDGPAPARLVYFSGQQGVPAKTWDDLGPNDVNLGGYVIERDSLPKGPYYFPEESLGTLEDQPASGQWRLEVLDDRAGPLGVGPTNLLSWQLQFFFTTNYPPAVALQNGVPSTNVVAANGFTYFTVDVPAWATAATNLLLNASGNVKVWFNQDGIPSGSAPPDTDLIGPATAGITTLDVNGTGGLPVLQPGRRYYLGVQNTSGTPVTFTVEVDYDITTLSDGVPVTATSRPSLALPRYFRYDVSTNASAVQFTLSQLSGNADLVVRHGLPVPTLTSYDYGGFNFGTNDESIVLFTNSVTLTPGTWYLGVYDQDPVPVTYTIEAQELTNAFPNIVTLTNGVPYDNTNAGGISSNDYYLYVVSTNAARAQFQINNATAQMALVAHKNLPLPDLTTYDYISTNPYPNDQLILVYPNSTPVALTSGDWFLTAVNLSGGPASYAIKAMEFAVTGTNLNVRGYLNGNNFCLEWDSLVGMDYVVQGKASLSDASWTDVSPTVTATGTTTTYCVPLPSPYNYFRVIEGKAPVVPPLNISNIRFNGTGYVLQWTAPASQQFQVQWTTNLASATWNTFTNVISSPTGQFSFTDDGTQSGGLGGVKFYRLINYP